MKKNSLWVKNPQRLEKNDFIIYAPRSVKIEPATHKKIDTEVTVCLPANSCGVFTSIFKGDEINGLFSWKTPFVGRNIG